MQDKIIMYESPDAARYVTNIEGWVDINGRFFGKGDEAENMARFSSHTHSVCECGGVAKRGYIKCETCIRKQRIERYEKMEFKEWDLNEPVCTSDGYTYFFSLDELHDYMEDNELMTIDLLICSPIRYDTIDSDMVVGGDAHENWSPTKELEDKIKEFNEYLAKLPPHSWQPSNIRTSYQLPVEDIN